MAIAAQSTIDVSKMPEGRVLRGRSGVIYCRRPDEAVNGDGLGEWRATSGGILSNEQVGRDAECELVERR